MLILFPFLSPSFSVSLSCLWYDALKWSVSTALIIGDIYCYCFVLLCISTGSESCAQVVLYLLKLVVEVLSLLSPEACCGSAELTLIVAH